MTKDEFHDIRAALRLSAEGMARLLDVESGRTIRRWEAGDRDIPGPAIVLLTAILAVPGLRKYLGVTLEPSASVERMAKRLIAAESERVSA